MLLTVGEVIRENQPMVFYPDTEKETRGWFTNGRVGRESLAPEWHAYDIAEGEDGEMYLIRPYVMVNHAGTFITQTPLDFGKDGFLLMAENRPEEEGTPVEWTFV